MSSKVIKSVALHSEAEIICSTICIELFQIQEKTIFLRQYDKVFILNRFNPESSSGSLNQSEIVQLNRHVGQALRILSGMQLYQW